jgi:hypothetical protein
MLRTRHAHATRRPALPPRPCLASARSQDGTLAQALKLRNVTREFEGIGGPGSGGGGGGPRPQQHVAVVGYPEAIFSQR